MTADWRAALAVARRPSTPAQRSWDSTWARWYRRALARRRKHLAAIEVADREMTERHGPRPEGEAK